MEEQRSKDPAPIGPLIREKRLALGMKQEELAAALGLTQSNVSRIESSSKGPNVELLVRIASVLGCDVRELMGVEAAPQSGAGERVDDDARRFVVEMLKGDPELGVYLRSVVRNSDKMTERDWKFLAGSLKLALGLTSDNITERGGAPRRLKGNF